jgi:hypothetical protein
MTDKVPNQDLLTSGLALMSQAGRPLTKVQTQTRAMIYELETGDKVRVRTCNDHILVVLADSADADAKLNIEGTEYLLIVMPLKERTPGPVIAYFLPTNVAVESARSSHVEWLASNPATSGNNRTWNLWFDDEPTPWRGFAAKWRQYRVNGSASTATVDPTPAPASANTGAPAPYRTQVARSLGDVIAEARKQIADAAGVPIDAVKISVNLA